MNKCDFCAENISLGFKDRKYINIDDFIIAMPRHPYHESHLLIFDSRSHEHFLHDFTDERFIDLKRIITILHNEYTDKLSGYKGYNLSSNNGDKSIGQHLDHAHIHLFMRFDNESISPFERMNQSKGLNINDIDKEILKTIDEIFTISKVMYEVKS